MKVKISDTEITFITEMANRLIDEKGWFLHIKEWEVKLVIDTLIKLDYKVSKKDG